jgi:hypothetical protein
MAVFGSTAVGSPLSAACSGDDGDDHETGQDKAHAGADAEGVEHGEQQHKEQRRPQSPCTLARPPATEVPPITTTAIDASRYSLPRSTLAPRK